MLIRRSKRSRHRGLLLAGLMLVAVAAGCSEPAVEVREPTIVGEVTAVEHVHSDLYTVMLSSGTEVQLEFQGSLQLDGAGSPRPGDLLLVGSTRKGDRWYYAVPPTTGGFRVIKAARVVEDHLVFDSGLRLPLADDFDYGITPGLVWGQPGALFLVDGRGEVEAALQRTDQLVPPSSSP